MTMTSCRFFSGYKPCGRSKVCDSNCASLSHIQNRVLIIHLGAIGAVVRATAILKSISEKYPGSHITWVTDAPSQNLLVNHPLIDRVLTTSAADILSLSALQFDTGFIIDKSLKASGVLAATKVKKVFGFVADARSGVIMPATEAATELWEIGLSDEKKFFENKKSEIRLLLEALELGPWKHQEYNLPLSFAEKELVLERRIQWSECGKKKIIGINTGCSSVIPYKKLSIEMHRQLSSQLLNSGFQVVLLGGPEDEARNQEIAKGLDVVQSPVQSGLRDGYTSVAACDVVVSGDSLGMHLAIAARVGLVAWFGPTCDHEIEFYGRGISIRTGASCSPCWKRNCQQSVMCYDQVPVEKLLGAINQLLGDRQNHFVSSLGLC